MHGATEKTVDRTAFSLALIVAMTADGVIGAAGGIPWDLPEDRRLFRRLTIGNTVIMGRVTYASLAGPLPERHNLVVTRSTASLPGATVCPNLPAALETAARHGRPIFVIGGVELYREALPLADTLHISWVDGNFPGDRFFPPLDLSTWQVAETTAGRGFTHVVYHRKA